MKSLRLANRTISTDRPAFVMGIVNATPDSFWKESRGTIDRALQLIEEGADILDLGGESTRPGSAYVSAEEEISRIVPLIKEVRRHSDIPVSIDTRKMAVMQAAVDAGADMLNDVSALEDDAQLGSFVAHANIPVILMHKRGIPAIMQNDTAYRDVFAEVNSYLESRVAHARGCGISDDHIILDPGIGFGKDTAANCTLIQKCGALCGGSYPVLMALSRKTVIGDLTGRATENRLAGTLAANLLAVQYGASLIRVHDVKEAVDTMAVLAKIGHNE
ncbi:MAG: dihydropteroate synthase [Treponema sp.]|nr:dihydropteroate synthase [Treponema sp.]